MSLTHEQWLKASERWDEMDKRLHKLLGFNPANSNHYGHILLYNYRISELTPDDGIIRIRASFLRWKRNILAIFSEFGYTPAAEEFDSMFSTEAMSGIMSFLGIPIELLESRDAYREAIRRYLLTNRHLTQA